MNEEDTILSTIYTADKKIQALEEELAQLRYNRGLLLKMAMEKEQTESETYIIKIPVKQRRKINVIALMKKDAKSWTELHYLDAKSLETIIGNTYLSEVAYRKDQEKYIELAKIRIADLEKHYGKHDIPEGIVEIEEIEEEPQVFRKEDIE